MVMYEKSRQAGIVPACRLLYRISRGRSSGEGVDADPILPVVFDLIEQLIRLDIQGRKGTRLVEEESPNTHAGLMACTEGGQTLPIGLTERLGAKLKDFKLGEVGDQDHKFIPTQTADHRMLCKF